MREYNLQRRVLSQAWVARPACQAADAEGWAQLWWEGGKGCSGLPSPSLSSPASIPSEESR